MRFEDNFVVLNENCMVDPMLKIAIRRTRFELDDSTQWFDVDYDPDLRPDHLWQKMTVEQVQLRKTLNIARPKDDLVPFSSKSKVELISIGIQEKPVGDELIIKLQWVERDLFFYSRLIAEKTPSPLSNQADELIAYLIRSMPKWYGIKEKTPCGWKDMKRLIFIVDKAVAQHLPTYEVHAFESYGAGNIVLDRREIV